MSLQITPSQYFYRHTKETLPTLNLTVSLQASGAWFLHNDPSMLFILDGVNTAEISGSGNRTFSINLTNDVNSYDSGFYELKLRAFTADGLEDVIISIYMIVSTSSSDIIMPQSMYFTGIRNVKPAPAQRLYIASSESGVQLFLPEWLGIRDHEFIGSGHIFELEPVHQSQTPLKSYSGTIGIQIPGISGRKSVRAFYQIHAGYDESFTKSVHFSKDNDELVFYKTIIENSFLKLLIEMKIFSSTGEILRETTLDLDYPFVADFVRVNIGEEIDGYFDTDENYKLRDKSLGAYPPIELRITALEIKSDDYSILNQDILPLQYFLKGRNPLASKERKKFWADSRPNALRMISKDGIITLSVFKPSNEEIQPIKLLVNNVFKKYILPHSQTFGIRRPYFYSCAVQLKDMNLYVGDELRFEVDGIEFGKTYIVRPAVKQSLLVAYLTTWNTFEIIEFTGNAKFPVEYSHELFDSVKDYKKITKKVRSDNPQKLVINTGWINKSDALLLDELIMSQRAVLLTTTANRAQGYEAEQVHNIELVPVSSSLVDLNTDDNTLQFDVEFIINARYENEIYSR